MPSTKQGGGHTLTFSKKNNDVKEILENYKKEAKELDKYFIANDYICEAIRFYEKHKYNTYSTNIELNIEKLIEDKLNKLLNEHNKNLVAREVTATKCLEEKLSDEDIEED